MKGEHSMRGSSLRLALLALALAGIVAASAAVAGAGSSASQVRNGGTLTIGLAEDPDALDPTIARTFVGRMVFLHMCEKLYDLDKKLNIVPQLAAALPQVSKDKMTYTIKLRTGIRFNDGTPLNAAAVKTTLDRYLTYKTSTRRSEISSISSVEASGNTVVLHLSVPFSPLTAQLADRAGMILSPKALAAAPDSFAQNPVCVGPFTFKDRAVGDHITLVKSPTYYNAKNVHLSTIVFRIMTDPSARSAALRAGDIQVEDRIQSTDVPTLQKNSKLGVLKVPTIGYQGLTLNIGNKNGLLKLPYQNVGTPLARSQFLRTAFDAALDRDTINKVVFSGLNLPDCYPISPVSPWYVTTKGLACNKHADPALAQRLVKASGVATPITVNLMLGTDPVNARLGQVIQSMEEKVGFRVVLQPTEFVTSLNKADAGKFDAFAVGWSGRVDPDGNIFGFVHTQGTLNDAGYSNPKLDYTLNLARKSVSQKARSTVYAAAMKIIHRDRPLIYLYHPVNYYGVSKAVQGVAVYGDGLIRAYSSGFAT
jgi:peptide/nickel transport system substrate-binding protein